MHRLIEKTARARGALTKDSKPHEDAENINYNFETNHGNYLTEKMMTYKA